MNHKGKAKKGQEYGEESILAGFNPNKGKEVKPPSKPTKIHESTEVQIEFLKKLLKASRKAIFPFKIDSSSKGTQAKEEKKRVSKDGQTKEQSGTIDLQQVEGEALAELGKRQGPSKSAMDSFLQAFSGNRKSKTLERKFDSNSYARPMPAPVKAGKVQEVPIVDDIGSEIDFHYDFDCQLLKDQLETVEMVTRAETSQDPKKKLTQTTKEIKAEPSLIGSKFLVKTKATTLRDDDFDDDFDPNKLKALNNDVVFSSFAYPSGGDQTNKQRFAFNNKVFEYYPRLPTLTNDQQNALELKFPEYPNLADNLLQYFSDLCESSPDSLELVRLVNNYRDYFHTDPFSVNAYAFKQVYALHIVNHINHFFEQSLSKTKAVNGFTKTRALVLTPLKADCVELVEILVDIVKSYNPEAVFTGLEKFYDEYNTPEESLSSDFRIGIKFTKNGFALFADYNFAELLICSPEGVASYEKKKAELGEKPSFSFFSSLEILILDKVNIYKMNDFEGFEKILTHLNKIPKHNDTVSDFNTIRSSFVENLSKFYRQTIVYTDYFFPELNGLLEAQALNYRGAIKNKVEYNCIFEHQKANPLFRIEFLRIDIQVAELEFEQKFNYFMNQIWLPLLRKGVRDRTVIFVSSDAEFIKLRNQFKQGNNPGGFINEQTPRHEMQRMVQRFNKLELKFLLVTERAHYFNICTAKKFHDVIFYSLPANAGIFSYYLDALNKYLSSPESQVEGKPVLRPTVKCLYSKFNAFEVERICGSNSGKDMLSKHNKVSHVEF